jgi:preprotein translocase subunit YajC
MTWLGAYFLLQAGGGSSPLFQLGIQFALILAIFYFLMIRPQQKQKREHEAALRNLQKGDEVVTSGGVVGQVVHIRDTVKDGAPQRSMEDQVTIRSGESRLIVERRSIARITTAKRAEPAPSATSSS